MRTSKADAQILLSAIIKGAARWQLLTPKAGEVCIGGLRYFCDLDKNGIPVLWDNLRRELSDGQ